MVNEYGAVGSYDASTGSISYSGPTDNYTGPAADVYINPAQNGGAGDVNAQGQELAAYDPSISTDWWNYPAHSAAAQKSLENAQALQDLIQAQASYHHAAVNTGQPQPHSTFENAADLAAVILAQGYGVEGKSLDNLKTNFIASSVLMSADPGINPVLMNQNEYLRQISNNPTAYGTAQPFAANAYFGQDIANTVGEAVAGVARSLGISTQAAAAFSGANYIPAPTTTYPMARSVSVVDTLTQGATDLVSKVTGGGSTGGGTTNSNSASTGTNWLSLFTTIALPAIILGILGYLIWTGLSSGRQSRSVA